MTTYYYSSLTKSTAFQARLLSPSVLFKEVVPPRQPVPMSLHLIPCWDPWEISAGFSFTVPLLPDSPAIGAGNTADCPATDQRGIAHPKGSTCDIGAFELGGK